MARLIDPEAAEAAFADLLRRLDRSTLDAHLIYQVAPRLGCDPTEAFSRMVSEGLLRTESFEERLAHHPVVRLREELAARGADVPKRAKKAELVGLLARLPGVGPLLRPSVFRLTDAGKVRVAQAREQEFSRRERMKDIARGHLGAGRLAEAGRVIAEYNARFSWPGMGFDWNDGHPSTGVAERLLGQDHRELNATPEQRRAVAVELALADLMGEPHSVHAAILTLLGGSVDCPSLDSWLAGPPCSRFIGAFDRLRPSDVAQLYVNTLHSRAATECSLAQLNGVPMLGVAVLPSGEPCAICGTAIQRFPRNRLPPVPRHWGCRCTCLAWLTSD